MPQLRKLLLVALLTSCLWPLASPARAQHGGGGGGHGGGGMGQGGGMPGGGMGPGFSPGADNFDRDHRAPNPGHAPESSGAVGGLRSRTQLGFQGRWWDDKHLAKTLKLRPEQQQRMDSIFESSRPALARSLQDYQQEQSRLDSMYSSKTLDENTLYAQIDKVSQTRAELGKLYTHFMLQIRSEMDSDQLMRFDDATRKQP